ncbi:5-formyltetrahydrofolate cyclo-ligase, partial [Francisella tularensis subsp. holarctica]|nr:5-formyltetrahydrofolate cyclo-ligase [Francisella tularensis subsp. holarctica]
ALGEDESFEEDLIVLLEYTKVEFLLIDSEKI